MNGGSDPCYDRGTKVYRFLAKSLFEGGGPPKQKILESAFLFLILNIFTPGQKKTGWFMGVLFRFGHVLQQK